MPLISCPECGKQISDRAKTCPNCGLPAKFFVPSTPNETAELPTDSTQNTSVNMAALRNTLIAFDYSYQTCFSVSHYITTRELDSLKTMFSTWAERLADKTAYEFCRENAARFAIDFSLVNTCLRRFETLRQDTESHNTEYTDRIVEHESDYFDNLLSDIDPNIRLDTEQRRAVVIDDDYCLLVAGAGAGKTTTMAAKVKYLVEKKHIPPEDIIVISYTRKAIDELKERINKRLRIPALICTFHSFAYDIVRKFSNTPPEVNYSAYNIIFEMLEKKCLMTKSCSIRYCCFSVFILTCLPMQCSMRISINIISLKPRRTMKL